MARIDETVWCAGCGVEITWGPVIQDGRKYCCLECAQGLACECGALLEFDDERRESTNVSPALAPSARQGWN